LDILVSKQRTAAKLPPALIFALKQASAGGGEEDPAEAFAKGGDNDEHCWSVEKDCVSGYILAQSRFE